MFPKMTHIAMRLCPAELRSAEDFYADLFQMEICFRETMTSDGWATLPDDEAWEFSARHDLPIGLVMLCNNEFAIDLEVREVPEGAGRYSHTGLQVAGPEFARVVARSRGLGCAIAYESDNILVFDDPYGMRWEFTTLDYGAPKGLSAGARTGRWARDLLPA